MCHHTPRPLAVSNEVIISLDDEECPQNSIKNMISSPLLETSSTQQVLPDLIPPGSIPGTPDEEEEEVEKEEDGKQLIEEPGTIAPIVVQANVECFEENNDKRRSSRSCSSSTSVDSTGVGCLDDGSPSSISTQPTELSSLRSSTSFDSADSDDVLIKRKGRKSKN